MLSHYRGEDHKGETKKKKHGTSFPQDREKVECHKCGKLGHCANGCKDESTDDEAENTMTNSKKKKGWMGLQVAEKTNGDEEPEEKNSGKKHKVKWCDQEGVPLSTTNVNCKFTGVCWRFKRVKCLSRVRKLKNHSKNQKLRIWRTNKNQ